MYNYHNLMHLFLTACKFCSFSWPPQYQTCSYAFVLTRVKNLIPCLFAFWSISGYFNPYLPFKFLIFYHSCLLTFYMAEPLIC